MTIDRLAADYVELVLAIGEHDPDYVDAYYGPAEVRAQVKAAKAGLGELAARARAVIDALAALPRVPSADDELLGLRHDYLLQQTRSAAARIAMLEGARPSFDEESRSLYDAVAPRVGEAELQATLDRIAAELDALAPEPAGSVRDRLEALRRQVAIPPDRITAVFERAIGECRARTARHVALPPDETFTLELVTGKPWSAYNWYQGGSRSLIQVNVSLPIWIDRAVGLAGHEGYPGHHVYNVLLEQVLVRERGWPEYQVYPLFSPQSLIAEGTANLGIEIAFPGDERLAFERDVLYPLAGLDPALAAPYGRVAELERRLSYAGNEAARRYLDGEIDLAAAAAWLERYALYSAERAAQRVRFFETYRSYVINYNLGEDLARGHVLARSATATGATPADRRWQAFVELISSPRLPSGLTPAPP